MQLDWFSIIILTAVVLVGGYAIVIQILTKKKGIETEAVVTNVRESWDHHGEHATLSYTYSVEFRNEDGETVVTALGGLSDAKKDLEVGDRIVIKYLKDKQEYPIMVRKL